MRRLYIFYFLILFCSSCTLNFSGSSEYKTNFIFLGKDKQQLTDLSVKWIQESLGINEIKIKNRGENQNIVSVNLNDMKIDLKIIIHDEAAEVSIQNAKNTNKIMPQSELEGLANQYEGFINLFSSNGIWERPKDYEE